MADSSTNSSISMVRTAFGSSAASSSSVIVT